MIKTNDLNKYIYEYMDEKQELKNISNDTFVKQIKNIQMFVKWLKEEQIEEINDGNIKQILKQYRRYNLKIRHNKRSTTKTYLMNIIGFLNWDEIQNQTHHEKLNVKEIIDVKNENLETTKKRIEKIALTKEQSKFLLNTVLLTGNLRNYAICRVFLDTGMRLKELVLLDKNDIKAPINSYGFYVLPENENEMIEVHLRAKNTKGGSKDRITFISYKTLASINDMILARITKRNHGNSELFVLEDKFDEEYNRKELFSTNKGKRFSRRGMQDLIKSCAQKCDERVVKENINTDFNFKKNISVHILRHTSLSYYAEKLSVAEVQLIAGHSSSNTTDRYIHTDYNHIKNKLKIKMEG